MTHAIRLGVCAVAFMATTRAYSITNPIVWVRSGQTAPQTNGTFVDYLVPEISTGGQVMFYATTTTNGGGPIPGLWRLPVTGPQLATLADGTPNGGSFYYNSISQFTVANDGSILFTAQRTAGGQPTANGWFQWQSGGGITPYLIEGSQAPGMPAGVVLQTTLRTYGADSSGRKIYHAALTGTGINSGNNRGVFLGRPGNTQLLVQSGQSAPGTSTTFSFFDDMKVSDSGRYALNARAGGIAPNYSLWTGFGNSLTPVAISGSPAAGMGSATYSAVLLGGASRGGTFGFSGSTSDGSNGAWTVDSSNQVRLVASKGQFALDRASYYIGVTARPVAVDDKGDALVIAETGTSATNQLDSLLYATQNGYRIIGRAGETVPGTSIHFGGFSSSSSLLAMNSLGGVVFGDGANIFSYIDGVGVQRQVGAGDLLQVGSGTFKTVSQLLLATDPNGAVGTSNGGYSTALGDDGRFWFRAVFTDGSLAIMSAEIPGPGAAVSLVFAGALFTCRRASRPRV